MEFAHNAHKDVNHVNPTNNVSLATHHKYYSMDNVSKYALMEHSNLKLIIVKNVMEAA